MCGPCRCRHGLGEFDERELRCGVDDLDRGKSVLAVHGRHRGLGGGRGDPQGRRRAGSGSRGGDPAMTPLVRQTVWFVDGVAARLVKSSKRARADVCCAAGAALVMLAPLSLPEDPVGRAAAWLFSLLVCGGLAFKYTMVRSQAGRSRSSSGGAAARDPFVEQQLLLSEVMVVAFAVLAAVVAWEGSPPVLPAGLALMHVADIVLLRDGDGPGRTVWAALGDRVAAAAARLTPAPVPA